MNPQKSLAVPLLNDNGKCLWDNHAICTYLIEKYAKNDRLYSNDIYIRARINQLLHFSSRVLTELAHRAFMPLIFYGQTNFNDIHRCQIHESYEMLEKIFHSNDKYLVGKHLTIADISCGNSIYRFDKIEKIDGKQLPKTRCWLDKLMAIDYFRELNENGWNKMIVVRDKRNANRLLIKPIVYGVKYTSRVISVLVAASEIGLDVEFRQINLANKENLRPEYSKVRTISLI